MVAFASQEYLATDTSFTAGEHGPDLTVAGGELTSGEKHLLFAYGQSKSNNHLRAGHWLFVDDANPLGGGYFFADVDHAFATATTYQGITAAWIDTPVTNVNIEGYSATVTARNLGLVAINVNDWVSGTDYVQTFSDYSVTPVTVSTTLVEVERVAFTPSAIGEQWLIMSTVRLDPDSNTHGYLELHDNADVNVLTDNLSYGCNVNNTRSESTVVTMHVFTATGTSEQTFKQMAASRSGSGADVHTTVMLAIKLDSLGGDRALHQPANFAAAGSYTDEELATVDLTTTDDVLVLGWHTLDSNSAAAFAHTGWLTTDNNLTTRPVGWDKTAGQNHSGEDQNVEKTVNFVAYVDVGGALGPTYDLWGAASGTQDWEDINLLAIAIGSAGGGGGGGGAGAPTMQMLGVG